MALASHAKITLSEPQNVTKHEMSSLYHSSLPSCTRPRHMILDNIKKIVIWPSDIGSFVHYMIAKPKHFLTIRRLSLRRVTKYRNFLANFWLICILSKQHCDTTLSQSIRVAKQLKSGVRRRKIRLIESNAKCRYLKQLTCRWLWGRCLSVLRTPPLQGFCLGWWSNFVGSKSGQKQTVKLLQNMVSKEPNNSPTPPSQTLSVYTVLLL